MSIDDTRLRLARAQLGTAMALFLDEADPISVQALACGGCELIEKVAVLNNIEPLSKHIIENYPGSINIKELRELRNVYWNAIKHFSVGGRDPTRDDEKLMQQFTDAANDTPLFVGWWDYSSVTRKLPLEAQVFQIWWYAMHEKALAPGVDLENIRGLFPNIVSVGRQEQKRRLRQVIEDFRHDNELLADLRTELEPLVARA